MGGASQVLLSALLAAIATLSLKRVFPDFAHNPAVWATLGIGLFFLSRSIVSRVTGTMYFRDPAVPLRREDDPIRFRKFLILNAAVSLGLIVFAWYMRTM